ncbi:Protein vip1 [Maublancomyces gigas]|uniref:Protein vip1 n=1 Tax=Discina gigas TaxID=1032678 RepID=A0ABR3GMM9_9PEZI
MSHVLTVHVSNISHSTPEKEVRDFFSFCGKVTNLIITPTSAAAEATLSATVTYERETAAKTALLLDGTKLGPNPVKVESAHSLDEIAAGHMAAGDADAPNFGTDETLRQEDKPRTAILAEYLSHGYVVGDTALQRGIELDTKHGISGRFTSVLNQALATIDKTAHVSDTAKSVDTQYHVSDRALGATKALQTYFEKALGTPTGKKIRSFYETGGKSLLDIHNEALRLAELRKAENRRSASSIPFTGPEKTTCACGGNEGVCSCEPGKCACAGCNMTSVKKDPKSTQVQFSEAVTDIDSNVAADYGVGSKEKSTVL